MSAQLLLRKRKREEEQQAPATAAVDLSMPALPPAQNFKRNCHNHAVGVLHSPLPSPMPSPPPSPPPTPPHDEHSQDAAAAHAQPPASAGSRILVEALQKIVELQQELDAFEHELDENDEVQLGQYGADAEISFYVDEDEDEEQQQQHLELLARKRREAESLGFAMCARETLLFLQREGVAEDSLLYRALRSKLVSQTDGVVPI